MERSIITVIDTNGKFENRLIKLLMEYHKMLYYKDRLVSAIVMN